MMTLLIVLAILTFAFSLSCPYFLAESKIAFARTTCTVVLAMIASAVLIASSTKH